MEFMWMQKQVIGHCLQLGMEIIFVSKEKVLMEVIVIKIHLIMKEDHVHYAVQVIPDHKISHQKE